MPISNKMLNFMPWSCRYCKQGFYGMVHISNEARARGVNLVELKKAQAVKTPTWNALAIEDPVFFNGFGHGNIGIFTGDTSQAVFTTTVPPGCHILAHRVVYLLSCLTAVQLGPKIIGEGGIAYGGFKISWTWMAVNTTTDPYTDYYAEGFYRASNEFPIALIQGDDMAMAEMRSILKYNEWINIWETDRANDPSAAACIKWLVHDRNGLVVLGDRNATITEKEVAMVKFDGVVSAQATAGEQVTITVTLPNGSEVQVLANTNEDLTYSTQEWVPPVPGDYFAKSRIEADELYRAAESLRKPFVVLPEKQPRTITLNVTVTQ